MLLENEDQDVKQIIDEIYAAEQQQRYISQLSDNEDEEPQMNADIVAAYVMCDLFFLRIGTDDVDTAGNRWIGCQVNPSNKSSDSNLTMIWWQTTNQPDQTVTCLGNNLLRELNM